MHKRVALGIFYDPSFASKLISKSIDVRVHFQFKSNA